MEPTTTNEPPLLHGAASSEPSGAHLSHVPAGRAVTTQACPSCGTAAANASGTDTPHWIYAVGRIEARFPSLSAEKEFAQAAARSETKGLTDRHALQLVLSAPQNRYLTRQICWVMSIEGLETYLLAPRDPGDVALLVDALRSAPTPSDLDVVIGRKGPIAPPQVCNGLMVPIVIFDQIYSFDRQSLIKAIPRPEKFSEEEFTSASEELFDRIMQITDNAGATDGDRALNYLAMRYHAIYSSAAEAFGHNSALSSVAVQPSGLSGLRNVVEVIFSYTNRSTDVTEKFFVRVDVTEEFPFLVSKLGKYLDR